MSGWLATAKMHGFVLLMAAWNTTAHIHYQVGSIH
jgi:hypothetical protein